MTQEENTKSAIDNSDSNLIEAYDREINRLCKLSWALLKEYLDQPNKESLELELLRFLEGYPQVKKDIERYARYALEQQLKEKENGKGKE